MFHSNLALICLLALCGCAMNLAETTTANQGNIAIVRGTVSIGPAIRLDNYVIISSSIPIASGGCLSGRLVNFAKRRLQYMKFDNKLVEIRGYLTPYFDYVASDPLGVAADPLQNECGNEFVIVGTSIRSL